jgi:hypothetical protein
MAEPKSSPIALRGILSGSFSGTNFYLQKQNGIQNYAQKTAKFRAAHTAKAIKAQDKRLRNTIDPRKKIIHKNVQ